MRWCRVCACVCCVFVWLFRLMFLCVVYVADCLRLHGLWLCGLLLFVIYCVVLSGLLCLRSCAVCLCVVCDLLCDGVWFVVFLCACLCLRVLKVLVCCECGLLCDIV